MDRTHAVRARRLIIRWRHFTLPAMAGLFGLYVALHSPLRRVIASLFGMTTWGCYFFCGDTLVLSHLVDPLAALALIAAALLAAWLVADRFDGASYERPLAFGLSALAFLTVPAATIGAIADWSGTTLLRPPGGPLLAALPSALVILAGLRHGWRPRRPRLGPGQPGGLVLLVGGLATGLLLTSTAISLMHPPTGGDALSYHAPLAVFLWRDGNLGAFLDRVPVIWALASPGTAELWYGLLLVAGGERLANLGQLPLALLGGTAVYAFTRRLGLGQGAGLLAACAFLLVPMVVMQIGMQPNDIAGAGLLMATMALACAPMVSWTLKRFALLGLGLGLVATTKLALLPCAAAVGLFVGGATLWRYHRVNVHSGVVKFAILALMFFIVVGPWWGRNVTRYGNPVYPAALPLLGRGVFVSDFGQIDTEFVPHPAAWPLYPLLEPQDDRSGLGALFIVGAIPGFTLAALRSRRQPLLLYIFVVALMLPFWWELTLHEPRFLLALFGLGFAFLPWSLLTMPRRQRRVGSILLAIAAILSAFITLDQALLPFAWQPNTRAEFYDRVWGVDPVVTFLPESEGLLHHTGYGPPRTDYAAYYPLLGPSRTRTVISVDSGVSTDSIVAKMRTAGVRYAYVVALPESRAAVEAMYEGSRFELVHMSSIEVGERSGARRYLYRPTNSLDDRNGIGRYLYRLK